MKKILVDGYVEITYMESIILLWVAAIVGIAFGVFMGWIIFA